MASREIMVANSKLRGEPVLSTLRTYVLRAKRKRDIQKRVKKPRNSFVVLASLEMSKWDLRGAKVTIARSLFEEEER